MYTSYFNVPKVYSESLTDVNLSEDDLVIYARVADPSNFEIPLVNGDYFYASGSNYYFMSGFDLAKDNPPPPKYVESQAGSKNQLLAEIEVYKIYRGDYFQFDEQGELEPGNDGVLEYVFVNADENSNGVRVLTSYPEKSVSPEKVSQTPVAQLGYEQSSAIYLTLPSIPSFIKFASPL